MCVRVVSAHSRNKGRRGELEWAKYVGGERDNDEGLPGIDVEGPPLGIHPPLEKWEVKRLKEFPKWLQEWHDQAEREGADAIAYRVDGGPWWIAMKAERLDR